MDTERAPTHRVGLFGFEFANATTPGLLDLIGCAVRARRSCWILTMNVQLLCLAGRNPSLREAFSEADVITADGMPIVWVSRLLGRALQERVTGSDLLIPLAERASVEGWKMFFLGGKPGVADDVAELLRERWPGLEVVGTASPHFADHEMLVEPAANRTLLATIHRAAPDVLLVAFGSPKQEQWIQHHFSSHALDVPVAIGVGASFDFLVGQQRRAPLWLRRFGLEWTFRMVTQPLRLTPRYARDVLTFARLCVSELFGRCFRAPDRAR